jgi:YNFM family putative membrane transporter
MDSTGAAGDDVVVSDPGRAPVFAPLAVLVPCALLVLMQLYLAIPLAPVVAQDMPGGYAAAALTTAYSLAYGLGFLIFGPLSDHFGRKAILAPGMAALAIATGAISLATSLPMLAVLRGVQGLLAASFAAVALAYVGEALPPRWRSTGIGAVSTAFLVAGIAGQVYAQAVADALGWRWVFALGVPAFALAVAAIVVVLHEPAHDAPAVSLAENYRRLLALTVRRDLALLFAAAVTVLLSFVAMYAALGPHLQVRFGLGAAGVLLVRLAGLPGMVLAPLAGWLVGRFGAVRVAVAGFAVAAVGLILQALSVDVLWALVVASAVFVAGVATIVPAMGTLVGSRAPASRAGAFGLFGFALFTGASCAPLLVGLGWGLTALLLVLAGLLAVGGLFVALSTPRPSGGRHRAAVNPPRHARAS